MGLQNQLNRLSKPLKAEEEMELWKTWSRTKEKRIRDRFVMSVYRSIVTQANKRQSQYIGAEDLIQAGMVGATKAFDRFDPSKSRFNTFAMWWVIAEMRVLSHNARFLISGNKGNKRRRLIMPPVFSLDAANPHFMGHSETDIEHSSAIKFMPTESSEDEVIDKLDKRMEKDNLYRLINKANLTKDEHWVIANRWLSVREATLDNLGRRHNPPLSKERIRQIEANAIRKIKKTALEEEEEG